MTEKEIMNEYGDCTREQMLAYLTKIQNLQKKAATSETHRNSPKHETIIHYSLFIIH